MGAIARLERLCKSPSPQSVRKQLLVRSRFSHVGLTRAHVCVVLGDRVASGLKDHQPEIREDVLPKGPNGVYLGELKEIIAIVGCSLCRFVTKALAQSWNTLPLICSRRYLIEVDIYYDGLFKTKQGIGLDIRLRGMTDYDVPSMAMAIFLMDLFFTKFLPICRISYTSLQ